MGDLVIRRMQESDLEEVCSIEQKTFSIPWSKQAFRDSLDLYHTLFLVAELDGQVAGYCGCYLSLEEAEITNMAVREDLRGRGIAGEMLNQLMELGRRQGAFAYTLEVRVSNLTAIHLYENLGFETVGVRKNFYEKPTEDAMIMWRRWQ